MHMRSQVVLRERFFVALYNRIAKCMYADEIRLLQAASTFWLILCDTLEFSFLLFPFFFH